MIEGTQLALANIGIGIFIGAYLSWIITDSYYSKNLKKGSTSLDK